MWGKKAVHVRFFFLCNYKNSVKSRMSDSLILAWFRNAYSQHNYCGNVMSGGLPETGSYFARIPEA